MTIPWLTVLMGFPLLAGGMTCVFPSRSGVAIRRWALLCLGVSFALTLGLVRQFDPANGMMQHVERWPWVPSLGVEYHLGVDGLGLVCLLLSGGVPLLAAWASDRVGLGRERLYYALVLFLQSGLVGTFTAQNFFHWFLFWELSLVPAYLLVRLFGGPQAGRASFQFFVYTMVGSVALLLGFLALRAAGGSFDFAELAALGRSGGLASALASKLPWAGVFGSGEILALTVFLAVLLGFAVKVPLWPFHTWLPDAYTEAPSPVTMMMTGVMSKMGVYGVVRIALPIFPDQFRACQGVLVALALATVVLPTFTAFAQRDIKRVLSYSSINHLGYCLLGAFILSPTAVGMGGSWLDGAAAPALNGVLVQILNHGLTAATLFACVEFLERRTEGVRDLDRLGGLRRAAPVFCGLMGMATFASLGLPGLNGFIGEFLIFKGVFAVAPGVAAVAAIALLATAVFLLTLLQRVFHGPWESTWDGFRDLTTQERWVVAPAVVLMLVLGVCPNLILHLTNTTVLHLAGKP